MQVSGVAKGVEIQPKMEFEDMGLVVLRLCFLVLIVIFGITGNIIAIYLNARSFGENRLNGIAYLHLACLDLLLCAIHAPIGIGLESCGFFTLSNGVADPYRILWFVNKQISLRVFFFSSFTSYVTLGAIAYLRCWVVFNPFKRLSRNKFIGVLLIADLATLIVVSVTPIPKMSIENSHPGNFTDSLTAEMKANAMLANLVSNISSGDVFPENTSVWNVSGLSDGKTVIGDHGVTVELLIYTMGAALVMVMVCYAVISYKLQQAFSQIAAEFRETGIENSAKRKFLKRQISHVKTHAILIGTLMITVMPTFIIEMGGFPITYAMQRTRSTIVALSSAINPYVYCLLKTRNRTDIQKVLLCFRNKPKRQLEISTIHRLTSLSIESFRNN